MKEGICIVGGGLSKGGQERGMTNLANYLAENGYDVRIICLFNTKVEFNLNPNIEVIWPKLDRKKMNRLVYAFRLIPYIRNAIKTANAKVVLSFGDWFNAYTLFATRGLNLPVFITNRMGPAMAHGRFFRTINKVSYPWATGMIVQTKRAKEIIQERYRVKAYYVVPNPVPQIKEYKTEAKNRIVSVGRLSKEKGHETLLRAFAALNQHKWTLHLAGDGPLTNYLTALAKELGVADSVYFHGKIDDVGAFLSDARIFVLPSFYEGFPNALIEAMAYGLAVVSSDCIAGPAELIDSGNNGLLFETGNHIDLADKLNQLLLDKGKIESFSERAKYVREQFQGESMLKLFENILFDKG